ncbi:MAG: methyltransferase domain-containing protein [Rhizomicrobium sp.]
MSGNPKPLFDFGAARRASARAARIGADRFLDSATKDGLTHRLSAVTRRFAAGLVVGEKLPEALRPFAGDWTVRQFDEQEFLGADASFDLVVSMYSLQSINDLLGALIQIRSALKPDGLFLATLFGGASLNELRDSFMRAESDISGGASPHVAPMADVRDAGTLLQRAGFALAVADVERLTVRYTELAGLLRDLRAHGQSNALQGRRKTFLGKRMPDAVRFHYTLNHSQDGKLLATFETLYLTGWAPHESQQKALLPGSARLRLSDALGTIERKI